MDSLRSCDRIYRLITQFVLKEVWDNHTYRIMLFTELICSTPASQWKRISFVFWIAWNRSMIMTRFHIHNGLFKRLRENIYELYIYIYIYLCITRLIHFEYDIVAKASVGAHCFLTATTFRTPTTIPLPVLMYISARYTWSKRGGRTLESRRSFFACTWFIIVLTCLFELLCYCLQVRTC